jgi:hypothetical protein
LRHEADRLAARRFRHRFSIDGNTAAIGIGKARHHLEQGGFAATGWADQRDELALANGERDAVENGYPCLVRSETLGDVADLHPGLAGVLVNCSLGIGRHRPVHFSGQISLPSW